MTTRPRPIPSVIAVGAALAMLLAACAGGEAGDDTTTTTAASDTTTTAGAATTTTEADTTTTAAQEVVEVQYATSFGAFGRDAYAYVALDRGYFEEAGFDVDITPGNGSIQNAQLVASGQLDYAPIDFSALVLLRANEDIPLRIVSFVHQQGLSAVMVKATSDIEAPADLPGHSLADVAGSVTLALLPIYADRVGFDAGGVEIVNADPPQLPGLLASDQVDAVNQFVVGLPLFESVTGGEIRMFPYADVFPELPGIGIVVSESLLESDPDQVERFIGALNRGLADAVADPQAAAETLVQYQPEADAEVAAAELELMAQFVENDYTAANGIGSIDPAQLEEALATLAEAFDFDPAPTVDDVYAPGFTG